MAVLAPIIYKSLEYPDGIKSSIYEIAGHLDKTSIRPPGAYSLHTEYSYTKRKLCSDILEGLPNLKSADINGVPQLWRGPEWASQFFSFIETICKGHPHPAIIEIHPPFNDYCPSISSFLSYYRIFEDMVQAGFPSTCILIENRFGSTYRGGKFIISRAEHIVELAEQISASGLSLKIALDLPQLLSAHGGINDMSPQQIENIITSLVPCAPQIKSVHLWGKKKNKAGRTISHVGNLDTLFDHESDKKASFLSAFRELLADDSPRYFVPEVNGSNQDFKDIITDLLRLGFRFI